MMRIIDVLNMMAKGEIKEETKLFVYDHIECIGIYTFDGKEFYNERDEEIGSNFLISAMFLNYTVELIPPKEKKYLIKVNVHGLAISFEYLNYFKHGKGIVISSKNENYSYKTHFTKKEMQSIQSVREFLKDMQGKYEFIEVKDDEIY